MRVTCEQPKPVANSARVIRERDSLLTRVRILEAAFDCIEREAERALAEPDIAFLVTRRVAAVARQARLQLPGPEATQ